MSDDATPPPHEPDASSLMRPSAWRLGVGLWVAVAVVGLGWLAMEVGRPLPDADPIEPTEDVAAAAPIWPRTPIAPFDLTERSGEAVTRDDLLGRPFVVGFIFTRCAGPCPKVSGQMRLLQDDVLRDGPEDLRLVTVTVDPDYDAPDVLARYAENFKADPDRWLFLTGPKVEVYKLIEGSLLQFVQELEGENREPGFEVIHTTNLLLVGADGVVRDKFNAIIPAEMARLRAAIRDLPADGDA
ncbi:MAG: SCO family protein [Planctomycetota bacterium]